MYPGVSPQAELQPGEEKVYHKYYMWVALVLACQTAMFMIPRYIWKSSEGGKIRMLIQGLMEPIITANYTADYRPNAPVGVATAASAEHAAHR